MRVLVSNAPLVMVQGNAMQQDVTAIDTYGTILRHIQSQEAGG